MFSFVTRHNSGNDKPKYILQNVDLYYLHRITQSYTFYSFGDLKVTKVCRKNVIYPFKR
jgi:hypothetical protein